MAEKNVKLKIRTSTGWDQLFPETTVDQITDASTAGKSIFKITHSGTEDTYIKVNTSGVASPIAKSQIVGDIGASAAGHQHKISDVSIAETGGSYTGKTLIGALDAKADLVGGVVPIGQLPSDVLGGLKFVSTLGVNTSLESLAALVGTAEKDRGKYWIAGADIDITFGTGYEILQPGDEGDYQSPVTIERGDWLVFVRYDNSKYQYAIINNTYPAATQTQAGVVELSSTSATKRSQLSTSVLYDKVVDERVLRNVMKDIHYDTQEVANAVTGDILFQEEV